MTATCPTYSRMQPDAAASFLRVDPCAPSAYENSSPSKGNTSYPKPSPSPSPTWSSRSLSFFSLSSTKCPLSLCSTADITLSSAPRRARRDPQIMSISLPSLVPLVGRPKNMSDPHSSSMERSTLPFLPMTYATHSLGTSTMDRSSRVVLVSTTMAPTRWRSTHSTYCFARSRAACGPEISRRCDPSASSFRSSLAPDTRATLALVTPPVPTRNAASSPPMVMASVIAPPLPLPLPPPLFPPPPPPPPPRGDLERCSRDLDLDRSRSRPRLRLRELRLRLLLLGRRSSLSSALISSSFTSSFSTFSSSSTFTSSASIFTGLRSSPPPFSPSSSLPPIRGVMSRAFVPRRTRDS
mmetsp:Transcript_8006/g.19836  ORF Transcript_8006/g.19836 Transcript_8006/m.19836 type:complete len:353 (+) Transcript_8006:942-2000(+)